MASNKNDSGLFLLLGTIVSLIGLAYLFDDKKRKVNLDKRLNRLNNDIFETDGFETDAKNLQKDWENIGGDFQRAKEKIL